MTHTHTITERAMLITFSIKQWTAAKHDRKVSDEVADSHGSNRDMGRFNKSLLAKSALEKLKKIANAARNEHYNLTLPWMDDGARILGSAGYLKYTETMREYRDQWDDAVADFVANYPRYVDDARVALNGLFRSEEYPDPRVIGDKFSFGFNVLPMPSATDFRVELGDAETARIRREIEESTNQAIETAMGDVWGRIRDVVERMADRLRAYKVTADGIENPFRDSLVQNARDLVDILPSLNITGDAAVSAFTAKIQSELLAYNAQTLRDDSQARERTAEAAEDILRQMSDFI
jgi:hypothetical protein